MFVLQFLTQGQCGDPLGAGYSPLEVWQRSQLLSAALVSFASSLYLKYPKVEGHLLLQVFNPFLSRRARESDSLHVGSTCMLFIRISSSVKLGKKLLFKALGGSKHY